MEHLHSPAERREDAAQEPAKSDVSSGILQVSVLY
jgi:hypothetical protein